MTIVRSGSRLQSDVLIDQSHDALIVRDLEDNIQLWSKGAERMYGWSAQEAIGKNLYDLLMSRQQPGSVLRQTTKSGIEIIVESRSVQQFDADGQLVSVLIANQDITEKTNLEAEILHAQRIESAGRLSCVVAHDLNNALSMMQTTLSNLLNKDIDADGRKALESSKFQVEHAAQVISRFLSLGLGIDDESTSVDLGDLICEARGIFMSAFPEKIEIQTSVAPDLWKVRGNASQLYQVLLNLCLNARDAMPSGGRLTIEAGNSELDDQPGRFVFLRVTDTGAGIPRENVASIFNPFFTTKEHGKGSGLGLYSVEKIVKGHKAVMRYSSELHHGTTFVIHFPAEERGSRMYPDHDRNNRQDR